MTQFICGLCRSALANMGATVLFSLGGVAGARQMHLEMLTQVFRWPMSTFDTTPTGRIVNRFSKDVFVLDGVLPELLRFLMVMLFAVNDIPAGFVVGCCYLCTRLCGSECDSDFHSRVDYLLNEYEAWPDY